MVDSSIKNILFIKGVREKIRALPESIEAGWKTGGGIPLGAPGRDLFVLDRGERGTKRGFSTNEGQGRLLHDLANIELQAMELAFRSFIEYPNAPQEFREQMADLALSEARHLELCLDQLQNLGFQWGDWPIRLTLWNAVSDQDSLLDRLLIVHRYLEASGLDAGVSLLKKLAQCQAPDLLKVVQKITDEEVDHVAFGSRWYQEICRREKKDPDWDFKARMQSLLQRLPKRFEVIDYNIRKQAGFTDFEIQTVIDFKNQRVAELE